MKLHASGEDYLETVVVMSHRMQENNGKREGGTA